MKQGTRTASARPTAAAPYSLVRGGAGQPTTSPAGDETTLRAAPSANEARARQRWDRKYVCRLSEGDRFLTTASMRWGTVKYQHDAFVMAVFDDDAMGHGSEIRLELLVYVPRRRAA